MAPLRGGALRGAQALVKAEGVEARVVSMPSFELFDAQSAEYKNPCCQIRARRVAVEAAATFGWKQVCGSGRRGDRPRPLRRVRALQVPSRSSASRRKRRGEDKKGAGSNRA